MKHTPSIYYFCSSYISFQKAGNEYIKCLKTLNVNMVDRAEDADIIIIHGKIETISSALLNNPALVGKYFIGFAVWETDILPKKWPLLLSLYDEIWTASKFCKSLIEQAVSNVSVIPHVIEGKKPARPQAIRNLKKHLDYDESCFYFYTILTNSDGRKNIHAAIRALAPIVRSGKARYIIKGDVPVEYVGKIPPGIQFLSGSLTEAAIAALHDSCHVYVSAHHAEGWGLCLSDAMGYGNLVVATGYSGNMHFMTAENSVPVRYALNNIDEKIIQEMDAKVKPGYWSTDMKWADVDENDLQLKAQRCTENWSDYEGVRLQGQKDIAQFSHKKVALIIEERIANFVDLQKKDIVQTGVLKRRYAFQRKERANRQGGSRKSSQNQ